jgi:hypothetical protein
MRKFASLAAVTLALILVQGASAAAALDPPTVTLPPSTACSAPPEILEASIVQIGSSVYGPGYVGVHFLFNTHGVGRFYFNVDGFPEAVGDWGGYVDAETPFSPDAIGGSYGGVFPLIPGTQHVGTFTVRTACGVVTRDESFVSAG